MTHLYTLSPIIALFPLNFNSETLTPKIINTYYYFSSIKVQPHPHINNKGGAA